MLLCCPLKLLSMLSAEAVVVLSKKNFLLLDNWKTKSRQLGNQTTSTAGQPRQPDNAKLTTGQREADNFDNL